MNIVDLFARYIRPYYFTMMVLSVLILFCIIAYYSYMYYYKKSINRFNDVANANRRNIDASVFFFHVDWCPHCKTALPEWDRFKAQNDGKEINGYVIKCVDMNCTQETSDVTRAINQYKIESYPTIKMLRDDNTIEFDSKITSTALESFINTMLND